MLEVESERSESLFLLECWRVGPDSYRELECSDRSGMSDLNEHSNNPTFQQRFKDYIFPLVLFHV